MFSRSIDKQALLGFKSAKNEEKWENLCKSISVNFLIKFKVLSKYQKTSFGKVKQSLLCKYMFGITLKDCFLEPKFLFLP